MPLVPEDFRRGMYYEPFLGAGALFLALRPARAIVNDANAQLALAYRIVKNDIDELLRLLAEHRRKYALRPKEYFYRVRALDRSLESFLRLKELEKAARLIFLNKTCYNGLYRVNSRGEFNVPFGRYKNPDICPEDVLRGIHSYFNSAEIEILSGDFEPAVRDAARGDFVYFDPPYDSPGKTNFTNYQAGGFGQSEQTRLRDVCLDLTRKGVRCLLSNSDTPFIRELYRDSRFEIVSVRARRSINSDSAGRGKVGEALIKNWK